MKNNKYSVKDLCDIFNINSNSFPSIAKRLEINTDEYCEIEINEFNTPKRYYNDLAYKKVEQYALSKEKTKIIKEKEISKYLQKIEDKEKTIDDLRKQLNFTQQLLVAEKGEKQQLQQQVLILSEDNKKVSQLETENKTLLQTNQNFIRENHNLEAKKYELEEELNKIKNRGFFARLFNK